MSKIKLKCQTYHIDQVDYVIESLKDVQQCDEQDVKAALLNINSATWPLFCVDWPTSVVMALNLNKLDLAGKRVLEIGCGIGLCSIVLHQMGVDITASDYHPRAQEFLNKNILGNSLPPIKYQTGNWDQHNPNLGKFDFMIGSDILYQPTHAHLVSRFIDRHSSDDVEVVIGDPGRSNRANFTKHMTRLGFLHQYENFDRLGQDNKRCKGRLLHYQRLSQPAANLQ